MTDSETEYNMDEWIPNELKYIVYIDEVEWTTEEYDVDFDLDREHIKESKNTSNSYTVYFYLENVMQDYDGKEPKNVENKDNLYNKLFTRLMNDFVGTKHNLYDEEHITVDTESFKRYISYENNEYILEFVNENYL